MTIFQKSLEGSSDFIFLKSGGWGQKIDTFFTIYKFYRNTSKIFVYFVKNAVDI